MRVASIVSLSVVLVVVALSVSKGVRPISAEAGSSAPTAHEPNQSHPPGHPIPRIDGAKNPELVPDEVAFDLFFSVFCSTDTRFDDEAFRAYLRHVFQATAGAPVFKIEHLPAEPVKRLSALRSRCVQLKSAIAEQVSLDARRSARVAAVQQFRADVDATLDRSTRSMIDTFVNGYVKRHTRIF